MSTLQPLLYEQAKPDPKLVHEVVMGPFKVKVDDGLNIRKVSSSRTDFFTSGLSTKISVAGGLPVHVHAARNMPQQTRHRRLPQPGSCWPVR